jgi:AraC-like DNA-binding protein
MRVTKAVLSLFGYAGSAGVPPDALLGAAGLRPDLFAGPDIDLLHSQELRLWAEAARLTADPDFGLHLAEWLAPRTDETFDVLSFALRSCATLGDHYRRASHYLRLIHAGIYLSVEQDEGAGVARIVHGHRWEPAEPPRQPVEGFLALALLLGRRAIGDDVAPRAVCFVHARPARVSEHERIFGAPVHFGCARNEMVLDGALLERPQRHAEPRLLTVLSRQIDDLLGEQPDPQRFRDLVHEAMLDELPDREPSVAAVASRLHMSPRTLQRRLQSEDTSFDHVLSELRRTLALRYLRDERIAIGEVGFLLGFRDVTAFHRAFKRWTGSTPARYRRTARGHGGKT